MGHSFIGSIAGIAHRTIASGPSCAGVCNPLRQADCADEVRGEPHRSNAEHHYRCQVESRYALLTLASLLMRRLDAAILTSGQHRLLGSRLDIGRCGVSAPPLLSFIGDEWRIKEHPCLS